jgi:hypothetical protein
MSNIFENREYLILPVSELTKVDFNLVLETSAETVRKSIDETKTFVKWDGEAPAFVATISGAEGPYTYSEILDVLTGVEWTSTGLYP